MMDWFFRLSESERWIFGIVFAGILSAVVQWFGHMLDARKAAHKNSQKTGEKK